jgi:deoxyribodipyrimidine photo-lyase
MVATFLTINCGVSWQWGARHFMNCLVDGDVAINHWQWQMQAGITNPLAKTFRIYNPSKNLQTQDSKLDFVHRFIPELADLNLKQILSVSYLNKTNYAKQMLDFEATRRQNGKIIADLRHKVRQRISKKHGLELEEAKTQIAVVKKYYQSKQQKYQKMLNHSQDLFET